MLMQIGTRLLALLLRLLFSGLRLEIVKPANALHVDEEGMIFAFWHGKMVTGWLLARKLFPESRPTAVVSLSKDGQILSDTLDRLGFQLIRGSSSKGGNAVKSAMTEELQNHGVVAVTPDGPRGPLHRFKYGTIRLASEQQVPVIFADISYKSARSLKSWDHFEIPMPFSRVTVTLHQLRVPRFASEEALQEFSRQLSARFGYAEP